ncbi:unnamed protein product, partial [Sphacelaria rigidula]
ARRTSEQHKRTRNHHVQQQTEKDRDSRRATRIAAGRTLHHADLLCWEVLRIHQLVPLSQPDYDTHRADPPAVRIAHNGSHLYPPDRSHPAPPASANLTSYWRPEMASKANCRAFTVSSKCLTTTLVLSTGGFFVLAASGFEGASTSVRANGMVNFTKLGESRRRLGVYAWAK